MTPASCRAPATTTSETFGFAGFDFSSRVHAERTTTFGDLFEEVLSRRAARPAEGAEHGADIHARTQLTFEEAWHGVQRTVTVTRQDTCRTCAGSGFQRVAETRCVSCEGTGAVRSVRGHMVFAKTCPTCGGEGRLKQEECAPCHGQGVEPRSETLTVRIPPAVADGARVRIAAKGHAGVRGGAPGDLLIDVSVAEHPVFRREGDELHMTVPIADSRSRARARRSTSKRRRRRAAARAARHAVGSAVPACAIAAFRRATTRRAAISSSRCGCGCRRCSTNDRRNYCANSAGSTARASGRLDR